MWFFYLRKCFLHFLYICKIIVKTQSFLLVSQFEFKCLENLGDNSFIHIYISFTKPNCLQLQHNKSRNKLTYFLYSQSEWKMNTKESKAKQNDRRVTSNWKQNEWISLYMLPNAPHVFTKCDIHFANNRASKQVTTRYDAILFRYELNEKLHTIDSFDMYTYKWTIRASDTIPLSSFIIMLQSEFIYKNLLCTKLRK